MVDAADIAPIDAGIKLGHHATDHVNHKDKDDNGIDDDAGIVSPWRHALSKAFGGVIKGAASIGLFTLVYKAVSMAVGADLPFEEFFDKAWQNIFAGAATGGIWYGGQGAIKAYDDANEHNQNFIKRVQDRVRLKERMQNLGDMVPNFGIIAAGPDVAALQQNSALVDDTLAVPVILTEDGPAIIVPEKDPMTNESQRPAFLAEIIEQGSKAAESHTTALEAKGAAVTQEATR